MGVPALWHRRRVHGRIPGAHLALALTRAGIFDLRRYGAGANHYGDARNFWDCATNVKGKWYPPEPAGNIDEVYALLAKVNPVMLTIVGYGGFAVIVWLMRLKPVLLNFDFNSKGELP